MALAALLALAAGCRAEQRTTAPAAETPVRQGRARVLHERDFVGSPDLRLRPEDTAVFRLEGGAHPHPDTATAGIDLVPMRFERPASRAFCVGESGPASVEVLAPDGQVVGTVGPGACATFDLEAGDHLLRLTSGDAEAAGRLAFIRPVVDGDAPLAGSSPGPGLAGATGTAPIVPQHYDDVPNNCSIDGPWRADELLCYWEGCHLSAWQCDPIDAEECFDAEVDHCTGTNAARACDAVVDVDSDPIYLKGDWNTCFQSTNYDPTRDDPTMAAAAARWRQEWCAMVEADCAASWFRAAPVAPACDGFLGLTPHGQLDLAPGQVAAIAQSRFFRGRTACPPSSRAPSARLGASCDAVGRRIGGVVVGPETQAILYSDAGYQGFPVLYENLGPSQVDRCLPMGAGYAHDATAITPPLLALKRSATPSVAVNQAAGEASDTCRAERVGLWCQAPGSDLSPAAVYAAHPDLDVAPPGPGEILLLGPQHLSVAGTTCAQAVVVNSVCDDLSRLGFEDKIEGVVLPGDDTFAVLFHDRHLAGKSTRVDTRYRYTGVAPDPSRGQYLYLPDPSDGMYAGRGTVSSVQPWRMAGWNRVTLITTGSCNECNLAGIDLSNEDLTNHQLVAADLTGANLEGAVLAGADLGHARLAGASLQRAVIDRTHLGCAQLAGLDTGDPAAPAGRSTLVVSGPATWSTDYTVEGARYRCDKTVLAGAKLPIAMLPGDDWTTLDLSGVTLLDLDRAPVLDGLVLTGGTYPGLVAGGAALSVRGARAENADLEGAVLTRVDFGLRDLGGIETASTFAGANLDGASLVGANLEGADLSGASLSPLGSSAGARAASLAYAYLRNARLAAVRLTGADLTSAYFYGPSATLAGSTASQTIFDGGVYAGLDFRQCKLARARFSKALLVAARFDDPATELTDVAFTGAHLEGATFAGADPRNASFVGARVSTATGCWGYADVACAEYRFQYAATALGATTSANLCPNGSPGPCTGDKLIPIDGTTAPVPPCIPDIFGDAPDACMSWEILSTGDVPTCNDTSDDVMQCGCLEPLACGG
jgi:uncharacterized protein YjbI with pentapeptide repeats